MLQKTHGLAGLLAAELVVFHQGVPLLSWEAAGALLIGCFAGPLADVDKPGSVMAKIFFPLSALLHVLKVKHRTLTHSILIVILLGLAASPLPPLYYWSFLLAYATHPLIDLLNERGVQLLWPLRFKIRLLPKVLAIDTGSLAEVAFRWLVAAAAVLLLLVKLDIARF
ncbi:metal-dependent hydrolase [Paenibacillus thalictri]|uniref:Metal-dependent hydrolase n=1 Tax=Paenibacillus thalictri TaxID=2527873 RepID=A0A4Q9DIS2_9BACL|nr:metal-dependent hydrolase [Paenibacillus thalictri]TBL71108.1 metal-dependent hydrolase [Paenibacillus thalictri]